MFEEQRYGFLTIVKSFSLKAIIGRFSYIGIFIFESHRFNAARYYFFYIRNRISLVVRLFKCLQDLDTSYQKYLLIKNIEKRS